MGAIPSMVSWKAEPYFSLSSSASSSSIWSDMMSLLTLAPPRGMTARCRRMLFLKTATEVVSEPISTKTQPERLSASESMASASARQVMGMSAMLIPALRKQLLISSFTEVLATMLRKRHSMLSARMPTGSIWLCVPSLYSCGTASRISLSVDAEILFSSAILSTIS